MCTDTSIYSEVHYERNLWVYSAIKARICQVLPSLEQSPREEPAHQVNLSLMITGIVCSRSVQQRKIDGEVPFAAQATSLTGARAAS